jgi:eukaryotic-like serine/threonine-protein kinase
MGFTSGTRLGVYEVVAPLGEGGMGVVYCALDTRLGRHVAIKVLPDTFAADPDRLARFEREARLLASLNHPHVAQIYGLESLAGQSGITTPCLVLELVEGATLADPLLSGPMSLDDAMPIARQIAEAVEAAHEQGIIHRVLKPANIKVTDDGIVKVRDCGLAKAPPGTQRMWLLSRLRSRGGCTKGRRMAVLSRRKTAHSTLSVRSRSRWR